MKRKLLSARFRAGLLIVMVSCGARLLYARPVAPFAWDGTVVSALPDTLERRRALVKAIEKFQDRWRSAWQKGEVKRHRMINLSKIRGWVVTRNGAMIEPFFVGDREAMLLTPELRRYLSMLCVVDTPSDRQIEIAKSPSRGDIGITPNRAPRIDVGAPTRRSRTPVIPPEPTAPRIVPPNEPAGGTVSWAMQRIIRDPGGSLCPAWVPEDDSLPSDESQAIDMALPADQRASVGSEREKLIQLLERAQAEFPADDWIAGQRVRFVLDQNIPVRTVAAARACQGTRAWCLELLGLALERADSVVAADSVFRLADQALTPRGPNDAGICADPDALLLLPTSERATVASMPCGDQQSKVETLWWLADPLWSVPGNERFVVHRARQTHARLRAALDRDERYVWTAPGGGLAQRELVIRYGWPSYTYWPGGQFEDELNVLRETNQRLWTPAPPYTAREYRRDRQALVPSLRAITSPMAIQHGDWQTTAPTGTPFDAWWPREHAFVSSRLASLSAGQDAQWRRDSTVLYAVAIDDPRGEGAPRRDQWLAAVLVGSTGPAQIFTMARTTVVAGAPIRLSTNLPSTPMVLGVEARVVDRAPRRTRSGSGETQDTTWFRARHGFTPPNTLQQMPAHTVALSPPVFVMLPDSASDAPTDQAAVQALMAGRLTFARSERVAVYWEGYGFAPGDTLDVRLLVSRDDVSGAVRRVGERLGVVGQRRDSVVIAWREPEARRAVVVATQAMPTTTRAVALSFRDLAVGAYRLSVEMRRRDGMAARSERAFVLRD